MRVMGLGQVAQVDRVDAGARFAVRLRECVEAFGAGPRREFLLLDLVRGQVVPHSLHQVRRTSDAYVLPCPRQEGAVPAADGAQPAVGTVLDDPQFSRVPQGRADRKTGRDVPAPGRL